MRQPEPDGVVPAGDTEFRVQPRDVVLDGLLVYPERLGDFGA